MVYRIINMTLRKQLAQLKRTNIRYKEALVYARHQSHYHNQIVGIEESTYHAWIHERTSKALRLKKLT